MSKKVVHLSDDAHELAKAYCKDSGMKMSDWVAMLIKRAVDPAQVQAPSAVQHTVAPSLAVTHAPIREPMREPVRESLAAIPSPIAMSPRPAVATMTSSPDDVRALAPKKKPMLRELPSNSEEAVPVYAQPPFWARKSF